jgi:hypothetical protein
VPEFGKSFGFDLIKSDWVTPNGKGEVSDFMLRLDVEDAKVPSDYYTRYPNAIRHRTSNRNRMMVCRSGNLSISAKDTSHPLQRPESALVCLSSHATGGGIGVGGRRGGRMGIAQSKGTTVGSVQAQVSEGQA